MRAPILFIVLLVSMVLISHSYAETATVAGTITHGDGKPAAGATVSIGGKSTSTDMRGRYRVRDISYGRHILKIKVKGELVKQVDVEVHESRVTLNEKIP